MSGNFFNGQFFGGGFFGANTPTATTGGGPGWQLFFTESSRRKKWKKEEKSASELRAILESAVAKALGRDDPHAEQLVRQYAEVRDDARPEIVAAQVDYSALLKNIEAVEYLLGVYYQRKVLLEQDEDDEDFLLLSS